jgi:ATP-dependent Clp protease, protease subunit
MAGALKFGKVRPEATTAEPAMTIADTLRQTLFASRPEGSEERRQPATNAAYISFFADINPMTSATLVGNIFDQVNKGATEIHLLFSTPGGMVDEGVAVYNVLRGLSVPLITHNVGSVNSIGNVIFLAGSHRRACPHATFMYHGVGFDCFTPTRFEEKNLRERLGSIIADQSKIGAIIGERTKLTKPEIENLFLEAQTKDTVFGLDKGVIHEVAGVDLPPGTAPIQLVFQR